MNWACCTSVAIVASFITPFGHAPAGVAKAAPPMLIAAIPAYIHFRMTSSSLNGLRSVFCNACCSTKFHAELSMNVRRACDDCSKMFETRQGDASSWAWGASIRRQEEGGNVDGENVTIVYHWAEHQVDRLPALTADLVSRRVDVIVSSGARSYVCSQVGDHRDPHRLYNCRRPCEARVTAPKTGEQSQRLRRAGGHVSHIWRGLRRIHLRTPVIE